MTFKELLEFNTTYKAAVGYLELGTDDYVASRCCLLNGVFPGLRLGAEAVEKYLKAFVLYVDPSHKVRKYDHGIKDVAAAASTFRPGFDLQQFGHIIDRLQTHYRHRYPDAPDFKHDARTDELVGIDELVLHIYDSLPIPEVPKFHTYGYFCSCVLLVSRGHWTPIETGWNERMSRYKEFALPYCAGIKRPKKS